ncbi:MAG TPA: NBR1-Ig-like domain-containing protein [Anaerolineaceae bacterium]|nr:hypothetical protein [Anaerolineaceae bacterium]HQK04275.1 NBR1-Ig-like domain-containing protein [Anaerolineaceae bacterium]HQL27296.1 NBR1-Ig-like domain-containing protein [Anaerolineaceae bacterium]
MKTKKTNVGLWAIVLVLLSALALSACNAPFMPTQDLDDAVQRAMQTLQAQATFEAFQTMVAQMTPTVPATAVVPTQPLPGETQVPPANTAVPPTAVPPTNTAVPTVVISPVPPTPTRIPPTPTRIPPTPTPKPCNRIDFRGDVTIPDGTKVIGGTSFVKTWRLRNDGSCTWTKAYDMAFVDGDRMGAPNYVDFPKEVKPGESIDLSVTLVAPGTPGKYTGYFMLVDQNGKRFGPKADGTGSFWVSIESIRGTGVVFNFAAEACRATWTSAGSSELLKCPGKTSEIASGYVIPQANPIREDSGKENEPGLITRPDNTGSGFITGEYPEITIQNGDKFKATIQCEGGMNNCDIYFTLKARAGSEPEVELGTWHEVFDNNWNRVTVDLSAFAGQKVTFYLTVRNGATASDNSGLWLNPIIYRP